MSAYLDPTMTPNKRPQDGHVLASGQMTPGGITDQLAQLDLPNPTGFAFPTQGENAAALSDNEPFRERSRPDASQKKGSSGGGGGGTHARQSSNADQLAARLASLPLPNPERLEEESTRKRRESISEQLSTQLAGMKLPRPERIFGGAGDDEEEGGRANNRGVKPDDWDKVTLEEGQEIPEAVRRGSVVGITSPTTSSFPAFGGPPMDTSSASSSSSRLARKPSHSRGKPSLSSIRDVAETADAPARKTQVPVQFQVKSYTRLNPPHRLSFTAHPASSPLPLPHLHPFPRPSPPPLPRQKMPPTRAKARLRS